MSATPKLPAYVICTAGANAAILITRVLHALEQAHTPAQHIVIFHAEQNAGMSNGVMFEMLQRVVSQKVAPEFKDRDMVLTVKIIPSALAEGLIVLQRAIPFKAVFIGSSESSKTRELQDDLKLHLGVPVLAVEDISTPEGDSATIKSLSTIESYLQASQGGDATEHELNQQ